MGRREMTAEAVYNRLRELKALPRSGRPLSYIAYTLSSNASPFPVGGRYIRMGTQRPSVFTVNQDYDWGADVQRMIRRPSSWLLDALAPKKKARKRAAPKKPVAKKTPKNAWERVLDNSLDDE